MVVEGRQGVTAVKSEPRLTFRVDRLLLVLLVSLRWLLWSPAQHMVERTTFNADLLPNSFA